MKETISSFKAKEVKGGKRQYEEGRDRNPHRGGRCPGSQPGHTGHNDPGRPGGVSGHRHPPRLGRCHGNHPEEERGQHGQLPGSHGRNREQGRTHGRHVSAHFADPSQPRLQGQRPGAPAGQVQRRDERSHTRSAQEPGFPRGGLCDPHRRRRHPELCREALSGRGPGRRHPENHGQRRARDRLLHRIQHVRDPDDPA